ncbi:MAG: proton-conducting transporter membrane subunit [Phycisphaerae bacterium]
MLIALLVGPVAGRGPMHDGVAALLFYIAVYGAMNLGVFAVLTAFRAPGVAGERRRDAETLDDLAGLSRRAPAAAAALAIFAFSLMGFPPTAGFVGKLYIFGSAFSLDDSHAFSTPLIVLAVIGVVNAAIAAAYYLRIIAAAYLRDEESTLTARAGGPVRWGMALCAIPVLALFVWPSGLVDEARRGAVTAGTPSVAHRVAVDTGHTDVDADRPGMSVDSPGHGNFSP